MSDSPPPLPPLPEQRGNRTIWIVVTLVAVLLLLLVVAIVGVGKYAYDRAQQNRSAMQEVTIAADEERAKLVDQLEKGDFTHGDAALARVKEQMEKSSANMTGNDAAAAKAMAAYLGKIQAQAQTYQEAVARLTTEKVFEFNIPDKATLANHREAISSFLAANAQLTDLVTNAESHLRTELAAANVASATTEQTVRGYQSAQIGLRPLQLKVRQSDKLLGDAGLSILTLLEEKWGRWKRNDQTGRISFEDDASSSEFNKWVEQVQTACAEQAEAQRQMAEVLRTKSGPR